MGALEDTKVKKKNKGPGGDVYQAKACPQTGVLGQNGQFCEEKCQKKVVQFQNGIYKK